MRAANWVTSALAVWSICSPSLSTLALSSRSIFSTLCESCASALPSSREEAILDRISPIDRRNSRSSSCDFALSTALSRALRSSTILVSAWVWCALSLSRPACLPCSVSIHALPPAKMPAAAIPATNNSIERKWRPGRGVWGSLTGSARGAASRANRKGKSALGALDPTPASSSPSSSGNSGGSRPAYRSSFSRSGPCVAATPNGEGKRALEALDPAPTSRSTLSSRNSGFSRPSDWLSCPRSRASRSLMGKNGQRLT